MIKRFICIAGMAAVALAASCVQAAVVIPKDLVGIWATPGSTFNGQALLTGQAMYIDSDGTGASIAGNGNDVLGVRFVVTAYKEASHTLHLDLTESRRVIMSTVITWDPEQKIIYSEKDPSQKFGRRFDEVSTEVRKSLGLEVRTLPVEPSRP